MSDAYAVVRGALRPKPQQHTTAVPKDQDPAAGHHSQARGWEEEEPPGAKTSCRQGLCLLSSPRVRQEARQVGATPNAGPAEQLAVAPLPRGHLPGAAQPAARGQHTRTSCAGGR